MVFVVYFVGCLLRGLVVYDSSIRCSLVLASLLFSFDVVTA